MIEARTTLSNTFPAGDQPTLWDSHDHASTPGSADPLVVDDLPTSGDIKSGQVFIIRNHESRYLTHTFHKYAGKFIPQIPRWALKRHLAQRRGAVVLDPFVGSGTTLVECLLNGQRGFGIDIDPLARLIAKVKTTPLPQRRLRKIVREIESKLDRRREGWLRPSIPSLNHWFTPQAVEDLSAVRSIVEDYSEEPDIFDFLLICFSSILRRASNADNQTMKTYVSHTHRKVPEEARPLFLDTVREYAERLIRFAEVLSQFGSSCVLPDGDARNVDAIWSRNRLPPVDLAVTSPPYIKSVDYIYNQMAELFWIGERWDLETQPKQNAFKKQYVGSDRLSAAEVTNAGDTGLHSVDHYVRAVRQQRPELAAVMSRYFVQMLAHFKAIRRVLRDEAHYVLVIGDSTLAGIAVPTRDLLIECARTAGFRADFAIAYEIRNKHMRFPRGGRGGEVHHDWIVDLSIS